MRYGRRVNMLMKALQVQILYLQYNKLGFPSETIFRRFVFPQFYISRSTFYNYLSLNARGELRMRAPEIDVDKMIQKFKRQQFEDWNTYLNQEPA